jgi:hypothetical protein
MSLGIGPLVRWRPLHVRHRFTLHAAINYLSIVLCLGLCACAPQSLVPSHPRPQLSVSYSKPSSESLLKIKIERVSLTDKQSGELAALPKTTSEFGSRWLVEERPDTMRPGPWTTRIYVFDATDTRHCVRIQLTDHAGYDVQRSWLNEKMLFVRVSWGRIVSTDFVLDAETLKFAYAEDANYFRLVYPQPESSQK